jgi:hypothetical protein
LEMQFLHELVNQAKVVPSFCSRWGRLCTGKTFLLNSKTSHLRILKTWLEILKKFPAFRAQCYKTFLSVNYGFS